jgi:hypothetical protein
VNIRINSLLPFSANLYSILIEIGRKDWELNRLGAIIKILYKDAVEQ